MDELVAVVAKGKVEDVEGALKVADALAVRHGVVVQLVRPEVVYNLRHLQSAWMHARRAEAQGKRSAKSLGAEFLLYVTGERQVHHAIAKGGIRLGADSTVVCAAGARAGTAIWGLLDKLGWSKDPAGMPTNEAALAEFGIRAGPDPEGSVLERVALLDLRK